MNDIVIDAWLAIFGVAFVAGMVMLSIKMCQHYLEWFGPDEDDKKWEGQ